MIEELQQLLELVKGLPDLAIYSLAGFGIYKLIVYLSTTGGICYIIKLLIEKTHDAYKRKLETKLEAEVLRETKPELVSIDRKFITSVLPSFYALLDDLIEYEENLDSRYRYIHQYHIDFLRDAVKDKIALGDKINCHYKRKSNVKELMQ